jgi:adenylate cyclase
VLAEFSSTEIAVRAATALSQKYSEQSARTGRGHNLRIGVHVGEVAVGVDGDLYGDCVNATARIEAAIDPGQVVISEDVWRQIRGREGFRFEPLGNREFKGVGLMDLYAVTLEGPPAAASLSHETEKALNGERQKQTIRSIAVLPFADLSAEADQEHFSDGVAEEILNALSKIEGLHVPARTSCFAFRGASLDARDIGKRLGVETLLDGSIRKVGKRVRISVELVDVSTGYQLWSQRFDREIADIFAIQDEIARNVLESLGLALIEREEFRLLKPSTTNVEAYEFYLRGRKFYHKWTRQSVEFARQMFERAVKIDPDFAAAWAGLANTYVDLFRWGRNVEDLEAAQRASERALNLNPNSAEAHVSVGQALAIQRRFSEAANAFERAIKEDPTLYEAYYLYGRVMFECGQIEKAANLFEKAHAARPDEYEAGSIRAQALIELARQDEARRVNELAIERIEKHLELKPDEARAYSLGASILIRLGEIERSKIWTQQALALAANDPLILYNAACNWALLGERERAIDGLERALAAGVAVADWITHDPDFESLRNHPRFQAIVKRIAPE